MVILEVNGEEYLTPVFIAVLFFYWSLFFVIIYLFVLKYVSVNAAQYIKMCIPEWKEGVHRVECTGCSAF